QVRARFELGEFGVLLLHGVTGSGKTEVYMRAVQDTLARGKTAIILVPEIALTLWIGRQCRAWFGARFEGVAVLHSALNDVARTHQTSPISAALHAGIQECLANKTQALVLINRRGYSWSILCRSCGASVQCANCSISMTHHKHRNRLECHYCGSIQSIPQECPKCQSKYVYFFGEGSEHL